MLHSDLDGCVYAELQRWEGDELVLLAAHCQAEKHHYSHCTLGHGDEERSIQLREGGRGGRD